MGVSLSKLNPRMRQAVAASIKRTATKLVVTLPVPPSVNNLYVNRKADGGDGYGRPKSVAYREWIKTAGAQLLAQKPQPMISPVVMDIRVGHVNPARDLTNMPKAAEDLLVAHQIIAQDNVMHVRRVTIDYTPSHIDAYQIEITLTTVGAL